MGEFLTDDELYKKYLDKFIKGMQIDSLAALRIPMYIDSMESATLYGFFDLQKTLFNERPDSVRARLVKELEGIISPSTDRKLDISLGMSVGRPAGLVNKELFGIGKGKNKVPFFGSLFLSSEDQAIVDWINSMGGAAADISALAKVNATFKWNYAYDLICAAYYSMEFGKMMVLKDHKGDGGIVFLNVNPYTG
ncbi:MAG: hypothetical protein NT079_00625, partial [Candidatus Omnitrophica bacterium]|nr:hypothetical protein [Candidatus Omnitrophota bacterium]